MALKSNRRKASAGSYMLHSGGRNAGKSRDQQMLISEILAANPDARIGLHMADGTTHTITKDNFKPKICSED